MKRWRVIVEASALHDIEAAYLWLAEHEPDLKTTWFIPGHSLETFPERCPLAPEADFFGQEVRQIFHGRRQHKFRILFTVGERDIHVLHVRHGATLRFGETPPED